MGKERITVALIGNPNVGKTLIFNNLTGAKQRIGNWPGTTVEKKEGEFVHRGVRVKLVDLPGSYSLSSVSLDEKIARDFILKEKPDVVVDIVDASNLERNLYLTLLLLELEANVVVALNMFDLAKEKFEINVKKLSSMLGVKIIPTIATTKFGMEELKDAIVEAAKRKSPERKIEYGEVEEKIDKIAQIISGDNSFDGYPSRWVAIRILEEDEEIIKMLEKSPFELKVREVLA